LTVANLIMQSQPKGWRDPILWGSTVLAIAVSSCLDFLPYALFGVVGGQDDLLSARGLLTLALGFYMGMNRRAHDLDPWWMVHIWGLAAGLAATAVAIPAAAWFGNGATDHLWRLIIDNPLTATPGRTLFALTVYLIGTWLLFVSGALLGFAVLQWTRRMTLVRERAHPAEVSDAVEETPSGGEWSIRNPALLGAAGTIIAALIQVLGD
jgi:hypothetical protein